MTPQISARVPFLFLPPPPSYMPEKNPKKNKPPLVTPRNELIKSTSFIFFAFSFMYPGNFRALTPFLKVLLFNARHSNEIHIPQTCNLFKPLCLAKAVGQGGKLLLLNKWGMRMRCVAQNFRQSTQKRRRRKMGEEEPFNFYDECLRKEGGGGGGGGVEVHARSSHYFPNAKKPGQQREKKRYITLRR